MKTILKSLLVGAAAALVFVSMTETALAYGKVGGKTVNSCEITVPFKLRESERAELERKGYRFRKKRTDFVSGRVVQTYEYYELKDSKRVAGNLYIKAIMKPFDLPHLKHVAKREFQLNLMTSSYDSLIAVASSVPQKWARSDEEAKYADFSNFPACVD